MLPNPTSCFPKTQTKVPLLLVIMLMLGLLLVGPPAKAQDRRANNEQLERVLKGTKRASTIASIPPEFVAAIKREYDASREIQKEISFNAYLANRYFSVREKVELSAGTFVARGRRSASMCADGACDRSLDPDVWTGAWTGGAGTNISNLDLPVAAWRSGLVPNNNSLDDLECGSGQDPHALQAHHSIVPDGTDPRIPSLRTVAPIPASGNLASLRLGNRCPGFGAERVAKTFVVARGQTTLEFWYAMVAQLPDKHELEEQPGFGAFLVKSDSTLVNDLIDIDPTTPGRQNFVVSDHNNRFFGADNTEPETVVYRDWTCVTIDLSGFEGETLTLVLVNRDCLLSGHWGYAYVDSFCLGCHGNPSGDASFNMVKSDCPKGELCFDYTAPKLPDGTTGEVTVTLELYQNGSLVNTLTSGPLTSDGTFCFTNVAAGLNPALGGFDFRAVANFSIRGATISPKEMGRQGEGIILGKNNDCLSPPVPVDPCCPPWNTDQLQNVLVYEDTGPISAPYRLRFHPSTIFNNQMKAYVNYLHSLDPRVKSIGISFTLYDQGTGDDPASSFGPPIPPGDLIKYTFNNGIVTGPNIGSATGFFTQSLQVNRWYAVRTRVTIPDGKAFLPDKCVEVTIFVRVQVMTNRSTLPSITLPRQPPSVLQFSDGKKILKSLPLNGISQR